MRDINMELGHELAQGLGSAPELPQSLADVQRRAQLVNDIDGPFLVTNDPSELFRHIGSRVKEIVERSTA